ncbi:DUF6182 family protein [Streptomyces sp. NPDC059008]|uniref:DUF6182 family protein n=1 Tax=Streptomyces sp. NPDC059008 TaxID=3346693 RepID=UPI0036A16A70
MTLSPELLLGMAAQRLRTARPELSGQLDLSSPQALRAAKARIAALDGPDGSDGALVVCVVSRFDLRSWVRETCRFALGLPAEETAAWRRSFTRTVYLSGRPDNLRERFAFGHIGDDGAVAWTRPAPDAATAALRRLLKAFSGPQPLTSWRPTTVDVPGAIPGGRAPAHRDVYVATARATVATVLVQLNHLLAEAVMDGLIAGGDRLTVRAVPRLAGVGEPFAALRIDTDTHHPDALQAYAGLTEETRVAPSP